MPTMTKRVNITTRIPIRTVSPPLNGTYKNLIMTTGDILKCISKRATVDEILPNGTTIRLNMKNYFTDNGAGLDAVIEKVEEPVVEDAVDSTVVDTDPVPEVETTTVVATEDPASEEPTVVVEQNDEAPVVPVEPEAAHEDQVVETVQKLEDTEPAAIVEEPTPAAEETGEDKPVEETVEPEVAEVQPPKNTRKSSRSRKTTQKPASEEVTEEVKADDAAQPAADVVAEEQTAE